MKFTKMFLQDDVGNRKTTVEDMIVDHRRWSVDHRRIFKHEGKLYVTTYSVGATESQEERPYEYAKEEIECAEVFPIEKTVIVYEEKE